MPDIEISREQYAYVEAVREELADEVTYGHVRVQDAVQYLIDHHREKSDVDIEIDEVEPDGGSVDGAESESQQTGGVDPGGGSGGQAVETANGGGGVEASVEALSGVGPGGGGRGGSPGGSDSGGDPPTTSNGTADGDAPTTVADADSEKVAEMMDLLDDHDDRWERADAGSGRYQVTLPDGDTEEVQTKDDVRSLLFRHYR